MRNNIAPACMRQTHPETGGTIRSIVDDRSVVNERDPQQRATDWLSGVANEQNNIKDIVMQELMGREDFQNA
jgi:hypothetical protein